MMLGEATSTLVRLEEGRTAKNANSIIRGPVSSSRAEEWTQPAA